MERKNMIGFQGVAGSFSEAALNSYFGGDTVRQAYGEFEDVFAALEKGEIAYGVLPLENSSTGAVSAIYDLLLKYGFYIKGESYVRIRQCLIGLPGASEAEIREVYSHPQGLAQCSDFLKEHTGWKLIPYSNTAASVTYIKGENDPAKAAIASRDAARLYGMHIIKDGINDNKDNTTRFVIIGKDSSPAPGADKASIIISLENEAGNLCKLLGFFAENNINLVKIESRPIKGMRWKYVLYLDFEGHIYDSSVVKALELTASSAAYFRLLGAYRKAEEA